MTAGVRGIARATATAAIVIAVDQATKQLVVANIARGEIVDVIPGLDLTYTRNSGVAFGALAGGGALLAVLIGVALASLLGYFALHAAQPLLWLPVGMLIGGALGNLADRGREGAVIDFVDPIAWPAFNVADACIVVGVLLLLYLVDSQARTEREGAEASGADLQEGQGPGGTAAS
jgi:signal peptidase II